MMIRTAGLRTLSAALAALAGASLLPAFVVAQTPPPPPTAGYTEAQATRGERVYQKSCLECHERYEYTGPDFRVKWNGRVAFDLVELIRSTMPDENAGSLPTQEYVDVVAYMFKLNGVVAGRAVLPTDDAELKRLRISLPANNRTPAPAPSPSSFHRRGQTTP